MKKIPSLLILLCMVALMGCHQPVEQEEVVPESSPEPTPPEIVELVELPDDCSGVWSTSDDQKKPFDIVLFENGQAVSTWVQSAGGARGERGFWRRLGDQVLVFFEDGRTVLLFPGKGDIQMASFPAGGRLTSTPATTTSTAQFLEGPETRFTGVWRLNREPDGSYLYLTLQSNGAAFSTVNGLTEGRWEVKEDAALCTWPDGWVDQISRASGAWHKKSWVGGNEGTPADMSTATRVGEVRFSLSP